MASLHFVYSSMNAGKSTALLQASRNYIERGMGTLLLKPTVDTRELEGVISSRIGLSAPCVMFGVDADLKELVLTELGKRSVHCVFVDEAQFLTPKQVDQLADVVDLVSVPVMCYGLRSDFLGNAFPGSARLLVVADRLREHNVVCACGRRATHVLRVDESGSPVTGGDQVVIGDNDMYISCCRKCHRACLEGREKPSIMVK